MHLRMVQAHICAVAAPRGEDEELRDGRALDGLRDRVVELPPQVGDGLVLDVLHARAVGRLVGVSSCASEEVVDLVVVVEVQPVPVDDRVAAEDEADRLEVGERELVERLRRSAPSRFGVVHGRWPRRSRFA
jgi:hypothetical protein